MLLRIIVDIFYYWRAYEEDIKKPGSTIGRFVSGQDIFDKLRLHSPKPKYIWAFKTPVNCKPSRKGDLQLLARLVWSDTEVITLPPSKKKGKYKAYYDPKDKESVIYTDTNTLDAVDHITDFLRAELPSAFKKNNFIGAIHPMEDIFLASFNSEIAKYISAPFWPVRNSVLYKSPASKK